MTASRPSSDAAVLDEARAAADAIIAAFGSHDTQRYFAGFAPEASFLFHNVDRRLDSRADYEQLWAQWEAEGFRVQGCRSSDQALTRVGDDVVVFTHRVRTTIAGELDEQRERETIVLRRGADGRWLAVHEHLSIDPEEAS